jgi:predicted Zn-dependent peptidase
MNSKITLPEGLRVITLPNDSPVAYCGIAVHAGTRNEAPDQQGLAHFCEHLSFKGTQRRTAMRIINDIEGLGGELNAFTNKEDTVFYCAIQREHLRKAIDVLLDIVFNSTYPQTEIEKECEVVCDEIESYEDSPADLIYDEFENILFDGHPLGHNILGTAAQVRSYSSTDAKRFTQKWYRPENCVMFLTHPLPIVRGAETPNFDNHNEQRIISPSYGDGQGEGRSFIRHRNTHQAHVMIGTRAFATTDDRRWALYLLNNILGGPGMNSRLNLSLRERHGLVYTVESTMTSYSDTGLWAVYFGCDPEDISRCQRLVRRELDRLIQRPLSPTQLRAAKRQLQGQLAIACDNREQYTLDYARTFLHTGHGRTLSDVMAHIDSLTAEQLQQTAQQLFAAERLTTLIYT